MFKGEDFVLKHIRNKHQDVVDETYERQSTKEWLERNIQQKLKKEMKSNYFADENKLTMVPGRKYHASESSYFFKGDQKRGRGGFRGRGRSTYIDHDDPRMNEQKEKKTDGRELVDYSDLFG